MERLELTRNIYDRRGLPSFYFRDVRLQKVYLGGEETGRMFSVKVWNKGNITFLPDPARKSEY